MLIILDMIYWGWTYVYTAHVWWSEGKLRELFLSYYGGFGDLTLVTYLVPLSSDLTSRLSVGI